MRHLQVTCFTIAILLLTLQIFRHTYVRLLERPQASVLDRFDQDKAKKAVKSAESLDELVAKYEVARAATDALDKELQDALAAGSKDERHTSMEAFQSANEGAYELEAGLRKAVRELEAKNKEVRDLRVFWFFGLAVYLIGVLFLVSGRGWLGISLIGPGVLEMIWWTSPSFGMGTDAQDFTRLLDNKLILSVVTFLILMLSWSINERWRKTREGRAVIRED
ncbi:hypothetical protein ACFLQU_05245 [Verrucomicrobiota bacterium]